MNRQMEDIGQVQNGQRAKLYNTTKISVNQPEKYRIFKEKWEKNRNRQFTEEETQKIVNFMKIHPNLLVKEKTQFKLTMNPLDDHQG